jgi:hypothetical protein
MPVLHLENVPEELYRRLECLAAAEQVPLVEETLRLLQQAIDQTQPSSRANVLHVLEQIRHNRIMPAPGTPDSVELLREDRGR